MSVSPQVLTTPPAVTHPYLWVVGTAVDGQAIANLPIQSRVGDRFQVIAAHLWQDTQPDAPLERDMAIPPEALPYLRLHAHQLHLPQVYGLYPTYAPGESEVSTAVEAPVLLLENVPVDGNGQPAPTLVSAWENASAARQLHWLWQMGQLWDPLAAEGVARSLLFPDNVRAEGWRLRLFELMPDGTEEAVTLKALGQLWLSLVETAQESVQECIHDLAEALMQPDTEWSAIAPTLNQALLQQAAQLPLKLDIAGSTYGGGQRSHNEDACYPITLPLGAADSEDDPLRPRLAIACDGIGGHAGGEVASRLVVRALRLQLTALLADVAEQSEPLSPDIVMQQLEAAIRVVNNLVAFQNDEQGRQSRQRMGTTLVMALQLPQPIETPDKRGNGHELYIAQVGDSRAYWLTPRHCHRLTLDDDVQTREVLAGRSFAREAARRTDAIALTQALGTRSGEYLRIKLQRFILDEDGVLLLCTDGLSDGGLVERYWQPIAHNLLRGKLPLNDAVKTWLKLANQYNGQDNISVVLMRCRVTKEPLELFDPATVTAPPIRQRSLASFADAVFPEIASATTEAVPEAKPAAAPTIQKHTTSRFSSETSRKSKKSKSKPKPTVKRKVNARTGFVTAYPPNHPEVADLHVDRADDGKLILDATDPDAFAPMDDPMGDDLDVLTRALVDSSADVADEATTPELPYDSDAREWNVLAIALGLAVVMFFTGIGGVMLWRRLSPDSFNHVLEQLVNTTWKYLLPEGGQAPEGDSTGE